MEKYVNRVTSGIRGGEELVYFLYYMGIYPAATLHRPLEFNEEGARRIFEEYPKDLRMDTKYGMIRWGEHFQPYLYMPYAFLKGSPENPSLIPFNGFVFILALMAVYISFWYIGHSLFGLLLILLIGSHPFQLNEVYGRENVLGLFITAYLLILAINIPIFSGVKVKGLYLAGSAIGSGVILSAIRQIRPEPSIIILVPLMAFVTTAAIKWKTKLALVFLLCFSFAQGSKGWDRYFESKYAQAYQRVADVGGEPYNHSIRVNYHPYWHSIWCGLGDFDIKHGYVWNDWAAQMYGYWIIDKQARDKYFIDGQYVTGSRFGAYELALRDKIIHDIKSDPLWYGEILFSRILRILDEVTPVNISFFGHQAGIYIHGALVIPLLGILYLLREWVMISILISSLVLAAPAFIIYSDGGMTYYNCYHAIGAAMFLYLLIRKIRHFGLVS